MISMTTSQNMPLCPLGGATNKKTSQNKEERDLNMFLKARYLRMARLGFLEMKAQNSSSETDLEKNIFLIYLNRDTSDNVTNKRVMLLM